MAGLHLSRGPTSSLSACAGAYEAAPAVLLLARGFWDTLPLEHVSCTPDGSSSVVRTYGVGGQWQLRFSVYFIDMEFGHAITLCYDPSAPLQYWAY